jgi:crossover junction endodeoxyribonuclease RusA
MTTIPLPWERPPITLNPGLRSSSPYVKAAQVRHAKAEAVTAILAADVAPMAGVIVTLHYRVPDRRRRDADNLAATLKVVQDALVVAGVLVEDSWVTVPESRQRIHPPIKGMPGSLWLTLEAVD